ncbi:hypothetical protein RLO149_c014260 [Roseobacter litoralis Och 149]|uniref:Uncharacterized protein n=1 Tax=Roseobacter litoralis (strain ATCC 49566 / DSM 6996 / JCM 21268 / NBRC 15278 / OCh 149) TaxID=391595 RepID=F7ZEZ2_ROSLO|nr:hypothetical protein RLO149_c014260 [Roseobacter litoralis Och 149]
MILCHADDKAIIQAHHGPPPQTRVVYLKVQKYLPNFNQLFQFELYVKVRLTGVSVNNEGYLSA